MSQVEVKSGSQKERVKESLKRRRRRLEREGAEEAEKAAEVLISSEEKEEKPDSMVQEIADPIHKSFNIELELEHLRTALEKARAEFKEISATRAGLSPEERARKVAEQSLQGLRASLTRIKTRVGLIDNQQETKILADIKNLTVETEAEETPGIIQDFEKKIKEGEEENQGLMEKICQDLKLPEAKDGDLDEVREILGELKQRRGEIKSLLDLDELWQMAVSRLTKIRIALLNPNNQGDERLKKVAKSLEEFTDRTELIIVTWQTEAIDYLDALEPGYRVGIKKLIDRKREKVMEGAELLRSLPPASRITEALKLAKEVGEVELPGLPEGAPDFLDEAVRTYYRFELKGLAREVMAEVDWEIPRTEDLEVQQAWIREKIRSIWRLRMVPGLISSTGVWLRVVDYLSAEGVRYEVIEEFTAFLHFLDFSVATIDKSDCKAEEIYNVANNGAFNSYELGLVLSVPEVQEALDELLEKELELKDLVQDKEKRAQFLKKLAVGYCNRHKISETEIDEVLVYFKMAFDAAIHMKELLGCHKKVLEFSSWLKGGGGAGPPELRQAFGEALLYEDEKRKAAIKGTEIQLGSRRFDTALFEKLNLEGLIELGFESKEGRVVYDRYGKKWETTLYRKDGEMVEVIVYRVPEEDKDQVFVVRTEGVKSKTYSQALMRVDAGWLVSRFKNIKLADASRAALLNSRVLKEPIGSAPEEAFLKPTARYLEDVADNSDFGGNVDSIYSPEVPFKNDVRTLHETYLRGLFAHVANNPKLYGRIPNHFRAHLLHEFEKRGLITNSDSNRLEEKYLRGSIGRWFLPKWDVWTLPLREPEGRKFFFSGFWRNFFKLLFDYAFEGTGLEKVFAQD